MTESALTVMWTINSTLKKHLGREIPHFIYKQPLCQVYVHDTNGDHNI